MNLDSANSLLRLVPNSRTKALKLLRRDGSTSTSSRFNRLRRQSRLQRLHYRNLRSRYYRHVPSSQTRPTEPHDLLMSRLPYLDNWHVRTRRSIPHWTQTYNKTANPSLENWQPRVQTRKDKKRRRRRPRNSKLHDLDGIIELQLSCSACSGLPVPSVSNDDSGNKYWLIMGRRLVDEKTGNLSNRVQVTFLAAWDRGSTEFKRSLTAIRTQPVSNLCPKKQSVIVSPIPNSTGSLTPNRNLKISRSTHSELSDAPTSNRVVHPRDKIQQTLKSQNEPTTNINSYTPAPTTLWRNTGDEDRNRIRNMRLPNQQYQNHPVKIYNRWRINKPTRPHDSSATNWFTASEARRRKRRQERRLWQQRQRPMKNQFTPLTDSTLRQKPINPYSNEPSSYYPKEFSWI